MAVASFMLTPGSATLPDGSASNAAPGLSTRAGTDANPKKFFRTLDFDAATDEHAWWTLIAPQNMHATTPAIAIVLIWQANATSGTCRWGCKIGAVTPSDADTLLEHAMDTATTAGTATNATEARRVNTTTLTVADADRDALVAGDAFTILVYRDADGTSGTDDLAVDAELIGIEVQYATA